MSYVIKCIYQSGGCWQYWREGIWDGDNLRTARKFRSRRKAQCRATQESLNPGYHDITFTVEKLP